MSSYDLGYYFGMVLFWGGAAFLVIRQIVKDQKKKRSGPLAKHGQLAPTDAPGTRPDVPRPGS